MKHEQMIIANKMVEKFRHQWYMLSQNPKLSKSEALTECGFRVDIMNNCFLCEFVYDSTDSGLTTLACSKYCPIDWPKIAPPNLIQGVTPKLSICEKSIYGLWKIEENLSKKSELAEQIANLPLRKKFAIQEATK